MSRSARELLADLLDAEAPLGVPPANPANAANTPASIDSAVDLGICEGLRISAKPAPAAATAERDSQAFAGVRNGSDRPESEDPQGVSQISQLSQGIASDGQREPPMPAPPHPQGWDWDDVHIARFIDRRARLLRWGWSEVEAEVVAERLVRRDRGGDARVACVECQHHRPGRCGSHHAAQLHSAELGKDVAGLLQCCPGFQAAPVRPPEASARPDRAADDCGRPPRASRHDREL